MDFQFATRNEAEMVSFEIDVIGDAVKSPPVPASRATGTDKRGVFQRSVVYMDRNWTSDKILPWFDDQNNEPEYLMRLISDNPTLLGLLLTKCTILHGQGLKLFRVEDDGKTNLLPFHLWPEEIQDFYELNDLDTLTHKMFCDFEFLGNFFLHLRFDQHTSLKEKKVAYIDAAAPVTVRALKPTDNTNPISKYGIAPTWRQSDTQDATTDVGKLREIAAYNRKAFFHPDDRVFMPGSGSQDELLYHGKRDIPGYPAYSIPHWYGARFHIELQNEIPRWHIANIVNQFGGRLKVSIDKNYIASRMAKINPATNVNYTEKEIKDSIAKMVRDLFTNPENVGKSLLTGHLTDHQGKVHEDIIITPIKLDIKDDAYTALEPIINNKITSSVGVQAALAAMLTDKGMSSGSEQTQAWNIEAAKATNTQKLILKPINFIHRYNGWDRRLIWGFPNPSLVTKDIDKSGMINKPENTTEPPKSQ